MSPAAPLLVINPPTDADFVRACDAALGRHPACTDDLQALLRPRFPLAVVRPRALSGERVEVWYVYRDGHWVSSS